MKIVAYKVDKNYTLADISALLRHSVSPDSWVEMGGAGFVKEIAIASSTDSFLAVGQSAANQVEVKIFFEKLRELNSRHASIDEIEIL